MFQNFLKVAFRNISRHKIFSTINLLGLAIGLACSILIALFVIDELSYDRFHEHSDDIYRIAIDGEFQGRKIDAVTTGASAGETMVSEIPDVINSVRLFNYFGEGTSVELKNKTYLEDQLLYTDSTFFEIFSFDLKKGDPNGILNRPNTVVLTEPTARRYFGNSRAMGKSISIEGEEYLVTGIAGDCPHNSHFHFDLLASMTTLGVAKSTTWLSEDLSYTYLQLREGTDPQKVEKQMQSIVRKHVAPELKEMMGISLDKFLDQGNAYAYYLQPLTDIHLKSHTDFELEANSSMKYVYIFGIIAIFILFIACINFMNLSTARAAKRAREVGMRKVAGATRGSLFRQFLLEAIFMSTIALFIGMILIESMLPLFNNLAGKELNIGYTQHWYVIPSLLLLALLVGIISGLYSAGYLSTISINQGLSSGLLSGKSRSGFRNGLVVFQFTISILLFISTLMIYSQLRFIMDKDLGYQTEKVVVVEQANKLGESYNAFKQSLEKHPEVKQVSRTETLPGMLFNGFPARTVGQDTEQSHPFRSVSVGYDLIKVLDLEMKAGRFFREDFNDSTSLVVNEAAVKALGYEEPVVGKQVKTSFRGDETYWDIIGVVKNFHFRSFHQQIQPLILMHPSLRSQKYLTVHFQNTNPRAMVAQVERTWKDFLGEEAFQYFFLDDNHRTMHSEEFRTGKVFGIFSALAIFIACLGLFGLASFMAEQKTKEIGIRKALGAHIRSIILLLLKQFTFWVLISNLVAWPLAYLFLKNWLQNFAYHIDINIVYFLAGSLLALLIAVLTVSHQTLSAAKANPVDSLRYE
jgi:putative ABC transport system permease protein